MESGRWNTCRKDRWFQLELDEPQTITKFIYTPKNGNSTSGGEKNGTVTKYRVECSDDGETWKSVSEGEWPVEDGAKEAVLKLLQQRNLSV